MTFLTENLRHSYQSLEVKSKYIPYLSTLISWQKNVFQQFLILCLFSLTVRILLEVIKSEILPFPLDPVLSTWLGNTCNFNFPPGVRDTDTQ